MPKKKKQPRKATTKKRKPVPESAKVKVEQRTNEELLILAKDMVEDKIFYDAQLPPEFDFMLSQIFAPLAPSIQKELIDFNLIGMLYEYLDKNLKTEKESMPVFNTMNVIHKDDMPILHEMYQTAFAEKHGKGELDRLRQLEMDENEKVMNPPMEFPEEHVHGPECTHE